MTTENAIMLEAARGGESARYPLRMYSGDDRPIQCRVWLEPEDGGYSASSPELPGVVSEGSTAAEAVECFKEAFRGALASYRSHGEQVPWIGLDMPLQPTPEHMLERWVLVRA